MFKQNFPPNPGVYWFLKAKTVIYVGKAKNLRRRLKSYPRLARLDPKTKLLLATADSLKWKILGSEIEAVLTESRLIRLYQPRFNLVLKDDKSPLYLTITKDAYPRILISRGSGSFGPFTSSLILRQILKRLRRIFPYCDQPQSGRACFYYHLNLCPGACFGQVLATDYKKNINHIRLFFQNKQRRLIFLLKKEMLSLAKLRRYRQASEVKLQLEALKNFWQAQLIPLDLPRLSPDQVEKELKQFFGFPVKRIETYDISNLSGTNPSGAMVVATNGRIDKKEYRLFNIKSLSTPDDPAMLAEMVLRRMKHDDWPQPDLIIVDGGKSQIRAIKKILPSRIRVIGLAKNPDRLVGTDKALNIESSAGRLLVQLRDEAHRFGRKQHLRLRDRTLLL